MKKYLVIYCVDIETTMQEEFPLFLEALGRYDELRLDDRIYGLKLCRILIEND
jgi:hypothetical protein